MLDGVVSLLSYHASAYMNANVVPRRLGNRHPTIAPYDTFAASDAEFFLAVGNDEQFRRFCNVTQLSVLTSDARFATNPARVVNYDVLRNVLDEALRQRPCAEWIDMLTKAGVPCGAVRDIPEVLADPQVLARQMIEAVEHVSAGVVKVLGVPVKLSATPGSVRTAPPTLGQHTNDVLMNDLGMASREVEALRASGAI
jgi:crotonobetainyl-CoA:carnitine CoA-transferase CaiB-like acyl-CoA transferase